MPIKPKNHDCPKEMKIVVIEHTTKCPYCGWLYDIDRNPSGFDNKRYGR